MLSFFAVPPDTEDNYVSLILQSSQLDVKRHFFPFFTLNIKQGIFWKNSKYYQSVNLFIDKHTHK